MSVICARFMIVFTIAVVVQEVSLPIFRSDEMKMAAHILPFFGVFVTWILLALAFTYLLVRRQVTSVTGRSILLSFLSGVIGVRPTGQNQRICSIIALLPPLLVVAAR